MEVRNSSEVLDGLLKPSTPDDALKALRFLCRRCYEPSGSSRKAGEPSFMPLNPPAGGLGVVARAFQVWDCLEMSQPVVLRFVAQDAMASDAALGENKAIPLLPDARKRLATLTLPLGDDGKVSVASMASGATGLLVTLQGRFNLSWDSLPTSNRWFLDVTPRSFVWSIVDAKPAPIELPEGGISLSRLFGPFACKPFPKRIGGA